MAQNKGRRIAHFAPGGYVAPTGAAATGAINATAQGLPSATPAGGYTPSPQTNAAGSWGSAAETGGIPGDTNVSPQGTQQPTSGGYSYTPASTPAALPAAAPNTGYIGTNRMTPWGENVNPNSLIPGSSLTYEEAEPYGLAEGGAVPALDTGGAIPDTADMPVDQDQGQEGQAGDPTPQASPVQAALSAARAQFGLSDNLFNGLTQQLSMNTDHMRPSENVEDMRPETGVGQSDRPVPKSDPNALPNINGGGKDNYKPPKTGNEISENDNDSDDEASL